MEIHKITQKMQNNTNNNKTVPNLKINKNRENINNEKNFRGNKRIIINPEDTFDTNNESKDKINYTKTNYENKYNNNKKNIILKNNQNKIII